MKTLVCVLFLALSLFAQQPAPSAFQKLPLIPWQVVKGSNTYYIPMGYGTFSDAQIAQTKADFEEIMDHHILEAETLVSTETKSGRIRTGIIVKTKKKGKV